jgi:hypothetical protein
MNNAAAKAPRSYSRLETRGYCPARHLTNDTSLRAEVSRARVLASCARSRPLQAVELVNNATGSYMRFAGASRYAGELLGGLAREMFLNSLA